MDKAGMEPTPEGRTGEAIRGAAEGAKEELSRLGDEVKEKGASLFHSQRDLASRQIHSLANALEVGADSLDEEGQARLAEYTRAAADRVHRIGDDFMERDLGRVADNVGRYARENPAVVIGGAAAFGFLLARVLRSSSSRTHEGGAEGGESSSRSEGVQASEIVSTDIAYSAELSPEQDIEAAGREGMAPGISPIGESTRAEDTRRRFGDGTES